MSWRTSLFYSLPADNCNWTTILGPEILLPTGPINVILSRQRKSCKRYMAQRAARAQHICMRVAYLDAYLNAFGKKKDDVVSWPPRAMPVICRIGVRGQKVALFYLASWFGWPGNGPKNTKT